MSSYGNLPLQFGMFRRLSLFVFAAETRIAGTSLQRLQQGLNLVLAASVSW